jgi:hypothetical protein
MGINFDKLKKRLEDTKRGSSGVVLKIKDGMQLRILPDPEEDPFRDRHFHYDVVDFGGLVCPKRNFNEECPICEFASKLWREGTDESKKVAKKLFATQRFYSRVIVRGEEDAGVRLWGYSETIYKKLMEKALDEDYGDFTDLDNGRDIKISKKQDTGKKYPTIDFDLRPVVTPFSEELSPDKIAELIDTQPSLDDVFDRKTTEEVQEALDAYMADDDEDDDDSSDASGTEKYGKDDDEKKPDKKADGKDIDKAFDDLMKDKE